MSAFRSVSKCQHERAAVESAIAEALLGDMAKAERRLLALSRRFGPNPRLVHARTSMLTQLGRTVEAHDWLKRLHETVPDRHGHYALLKLLSAARATPATRVQLGLSDMEREALDRVIDLGEDPGSAVEFAATLRSGETASLRVFLLAEAAIELRSRDRPWRGRARQALQEFERWDGELEGVAASSAAWAEVLLRSDSPTIDFSVPKQATPQRHMEAVVQKVVQVADAISDVHRGLADIEELGVPRVSVASMRRRACLYEEFSEAIHHVQLAPPGVAAGSSARTMKASMERVARQYAECSALADRLAALALSRQAGEPNTKSGLLARGDIERLTDCVDEYRPGDSDAVECAGELLWPEEAKCDDPVRRPGSWLQVPAVACPQDSPKGEPAPSPIDWPDAVSPD